MKFQITLLNLLVFACCSVMVMAQKSPQFSSEWKGQIGITSGIGLVPTSYAAGNPTQPPLEFGIAYCFHKKISIGLAYGMAAYISNADHFDNHWRFKSKYIAFRPLVHFAKSKKYDFYGGLMLGALNQKIMMPASIEPKAMNSMITRFGIQHNKTTVLYSAIIGAKRFIGKHVMVYAEAGYGLSMLTTGIGYNFQK